MEVMSILAWGVLKICIGLLNLMQRNSLSAQETCKGLLQAIVKLTPCLALFIVMCAISQLRLVASNEVIVLPISSLKLGFLIVLCLVYLFMIISVITGAIIT